MIATSVNTLFLRVDSVVLFDNNDKFLMKSVTNYEASINIAAVNLI